MVEVPVRTVNPLNNRRHWRAVWRASSAVRMATHQHMKQLGKPPAPPVTVTLTRLSAGTLDGDNLQAALKPARDGVQDWLGIDDGSELLTWRYGQERCKRGSYGVRIEVDAGAPVEETGKGKSSKKSLRRGNQPWDGK